jgi:hypothetical protein
LDVIDSHHSAITLKGHLYGLKHHILAQLRQCVVAQKNRRIATELWENHHQNEDVPRCSNAIKMITLW